MQPGLGEGGTAVKRSNRSFSSRERAGECGGQRGSSKKRSASGLQKAFCLLRASHLNPREGKAVYTVDTRREE